MRAAFCGKGGSGKTSLAALFTHYAVSKNYPTLAIDGDINQHLGDNLFLADDVLASLPRLGEDATAFLEYARGTNPRIEKPTQISEATPAGRGSQFVTLQDDNPVKQRYMHQNGALHFLAMGGHQENDVGATCYHKFTGILGAFMNHLLDDENQVIVSDMCAGADPFASSGLASRFDAIFLICEPTKKSLAVFDQALHYSQFHQLKLFVIGNKIETQDDEDYIRETVGEHYLTGFKSQQAFRKAERGRAYQLSDFDAETHASLETLLQTLKAQMPRDWKKYREIGMFFHKRAAESWANRSYGCDLMQQYDPEFDYNDPYALEKQAA